MALRKDKTAGTETAPAPSTTDSGGASTGDAAQGMGVPARSQARLVARRFVRHKGAVAGMVGLGAVVALAATSIGWGPIPGWWDQDFSATGAVAGTGEPTLNLWPSFLGGSGVQLGEHPFGQDDVGRDYFALTMRGAQVSLTIAFIVGIVATVIGTAIGAVAGYFRGFSESVLMRFTDVVITIPTLLFAGMVAAIWGDRGIIVLALALGLVTWTPTARLIRGEVLSIREKEFVVAARSFGTSAQRIILKHILPNTVGIIIVSVTLAIASAIILESALSFLGLGVQPPDTSLGRIISDYQNALTVRPWLFYWPGLFIIAIVLSVNFIGDGLRDAFDPRQNRVRD